jgi:hypothetical protein
MAFQKGQSGNPGGRPSERPWRDALLLALNERAGKKKTDPKKLRKVADAVVAAAIEGDVTAAREIGDRLDGKPTQVLSGVDGGPIQHSVKVAFVKPNA